MLKLFEEYPRIEKRILGRKFLFVGLDYDGTLTPIVDHPDWAWLSPETKASVAKLRRLPNTLVCIISGRSCDDLKRRVKIRRIIYAGNHGMEIKGKGLSFSVGNLRKYVQEIDQICRNLNRRLKSLRGVWVENKRLTASVHYRLADSQDIQRARQVCFSTLETCQDLELRGGKKVWEIRPSNDWNKGKALAHILKRCLGENWKSKSAVVYVGDDQTDEDAFSLLQKHGVTAMVSRKPLRASSAKYSLADSEEVTGFLRWLGNLWENKGVKSKTAGKDPF